MKNTMKFRSKFMATWCVHSSAFGNYVCVVLTVSFHPPTSSGVPHHLRSGEDPQIRQGLTTSFNLQNKAILKPSICQSMVLITNIVSNPQQVLVFKPWAYECSIIVHIAFTCYHYLEYFYGFHVLTAQCSFMQQNRMAVQPHQSINKITSTPFQWHTYTQQQLQGIQQAQAHF